MKKVIRPVFLLCVLVGSIFIGQKISVKALTYAASINMEFSPSTMVAGETVKLIIKIYNPNEFPLANASFTDSLIGVQPGLSIASPSNLSSDCGGLVIAQAGTTTITLSGGSVPAKVLTTNGECTISVDVTSTTPGSLVNIIPAYAEPAYGGAGLYSTARGGLDIITNLTPTSISLLVSAVEPPSMDKNFVSDTVWVGQSSQLEINIHNNDETTTLTQATFTDTLPASFTVAAPLTISLDDCGAGTISTSVGANTITLNNATITPSTVCRVRVRVVSNVQGEYTNIIPAGPTGTGSLYTQQGVYNTSPVTADINVQAVGILKSFSPTRIQKGDSSLLTITLRNPTGAAYEGVDLVDALPAGLTITGTTVASQCGGTVTTTSGSISLADGIVPAGSITTPGYCFIVARVTSDTAATYTNTIHVGDVSGPLTNIFETSATLTVDPRVIKVAKTFGSDFVQGGTTPLSIQLRNGASTSLTGVDFTDVMPTNMTVVGTPTASASCGGAAVVTSTANSITINNAIIPPGTVNSPGTCTVYATVTSAVSGSFSNSIAQGVVTSDQGVTNDAVTTTVTSFSIGGNATVAKAFQTSPILAGSPTRLRITITSPNDIGLSNISIIDNLPGDMVIMGTPAIPTTTCGGSLLADIGSNVIQLTGGTIANPRSSCAITVYVTSLTAGLKTNSIPGNTLSSFEGRTDPNNREASVVVTSFSMTKAFSPDTISPGGLSRLTISLRNSSLLPITDVTLTDLLTSMAIEGDASGDMVVVGPDNGNVATTCGGTVTAITGEQTISLSGGSIPASDGLVPGLCTVSVQVQGLGRETPELTPRKNTTLRTNVSGSISGMGTINPVSDAEAELVITELFIDINKKFSPTTVIGGSAAQMQITLKNLNDVLLSGIGFTDTMPEGMILSEPIDFNVGTCGGTLVKNTINKFTYSGGSLPANTECVLTLNTTMTVINTLINTIEAGGVTTFEGATNPDSTTATLLNLSGVSITKAFSPNPIPMGTYSLLTITITNQNENESGDLTGLGLNDTLPGGLTIAAYPPAPNPVTDCGGTSTLTAVAGTQLIKLENGAVSHQSSCTIVIPVTSTIPNSYQNIIPPGPLTNFPAEDTLDVTGFSLGNRVWADNGAGGGILNNGIRDRSEPGLSGVIINLYQDSLGDGIPDGSLIKTTTTDSNGYYRFDNLVPDTYLIEAVTPNGYIASTVNGGDSDSNPLDNDNNAFVDSGTSMFSTPVTIETTPGEPTGETDPVTNPSSGEPGDEYSNRTIDFGFFQPYALGNRVWNDNGAGSGVANNGLLDGTEPGFSNVRVNLLSGTGSFLAFTNTDSNGYYRFDNLTAGTYIIEVIPPLGYTSSPIRFSDPDTNQADNDNNGAVLSGNNLRSEIITLGPGASEPTSDNDPTTNPLTGEAPDAYSNRTVDFGLVSTYSLGNRVWDDNGSGSGGAANDGLRNGTEPGLSGVIVNLYQDTNDDGDPDGAAIVTTMTDGNGYYRFDGLLADTFIVEIITPSGYTPSSVNAGDPDDSPADNDNNGVVLSGSNIRSNPVTLGPGTSEPVGDDDPSTNPAAGEAEDAYSNRTVDFGFFHLPYSIGNRVWNDLDADGFLDTGELGLANVPVRIFRDSTNDGVADGFAIGTVLTNSDGYYRFDNLIADTYIIEVVPPVGYVISNINGGDPDNNTDLDNNGVVISGSNIRSNPVTLGPGDLEPLGEADPATNPESGEAADGYSNRTVDFGFTPLASIGNFVWIDLNQDGIQDADEPGLTGVTVNLYTEGGSLTGTMTTGAGGAYSFINLTPGNYYLVFSRASGYIFTSPNVGLDSADSDAVYTLPEDATALTATTTLAPGENDTSWDAGMYQQRATIGDFVWNDTNRDGIQDVGESGLPSVTIDLYRPNYGPDGIQYTSDDDLSISTVSTDVNGAYSFTQLIPGDYYVIFTPPSAYAISPKDIGSDDLKDSDAAVANGQTATTTLIPGENDPSWDAGLYQLASLGDRVWLDNDRNGVQDGGESGVNGVTVELYQPGVDGNVNTSDDVYISSATTTTVTGVSGIYKFKDLVPGDYYLVFSAPGGYALTPLDLGSDDALDSDANATTGLTTKITLAGGNNDDKWDAGLFQLASIGDRVWNDRELIPNGIQNDGEPGINGVTVKLYQPGLDNAAGTADDVLVATTTTSTIVSAGTYQFNNLIPDKYFVVVTPPDGFGFTLVDQGSDNAVDSDADPANGIMPITTLTPGLNDPTWDAGVYQLLSSIGNLVWEDLNGNGLQDLPGESGLDGVSVALYRPGYGADGVAGNTDDNAAVSSTITAGGGLYSFTNLTPGYYNLVFTSPSGYLLTLLNQGSDTLIDSDAIPPNGGIVLTLLDPGENDMTWDVGFVQPASLGDFVWNDSNANGIQDSGELGISGVTVNLYRDQVGFGLVGTTTTDSNGAYSFTNLLPANYYLVFTRPTGYVFTLPNGGADDAKDSDAVHVQKEDATAQTATAALDSGENDPSWDAGFYQYATIGNFVWTDLDADGVQDGGSETGISGVTVTLHNVSTGIDTTTTTNGVGNYSFTGLVPGEYYITVTKPTGYLFSPLDASGNDTTDSDAILATGQMTTTTLISNETDNTWDAGLYQPAAIGDILWVDTNGNGTQDGGEIGLDGVNVDLYRPGFGPDGIAGNGDDNSIVTSTTTAGGGLYSFTNLTPSNYFVDFSLPLGYQFTLSDQGSNLTDSDAIRTAGSTLGQTATTALTSNETDNTWDAGVYQPASIGDYVWVDTNGNGVQDGGEVGLNNVTVTLYNGAGVSQGTTTTNASGAYSFTNLIPGNYYLNFAKPAGYSLTPADLGGNDLLDSDPNISNGNTSQTALTSNENDTTWDAGMYLPASIGNFVWNDLNANGVQDVGEPGIINVSVTLYSAAGVIQGTTVTNNSGIYSFTNLIPGDYFLLFVLPGGYSVSPLVQFADDS